MPANPLDDGQSLPDATSGLTRQTQPIAYPGARSRNDRLTLTTKPAVVGVLAVGVREIGGSGTQCGCGGLQGRCCRSAVDGGRHGNRSTSMLLSGVTEASLCTDLDRPQFHTGRIHETGRRHPIRSSGYTVAPTKGATSPTQRDIHRNST